MINHKPVVLTLSPCHAADLWTMLQLVPNQSEAKYSFDRLKSAMRQAGYGSIEQLDTAARQEICEKISEKMGTTDWAVVEDDGTTFISGEEETDSYDFE